MKWKTEGPVRVRLGVMTFLAHLTARRGMEARLLFNEPFARMVHAPTVPQKRIIAIAAAVFLINPTFLRMDRPGK